MTAKRFWNITFPILRNKFVLTILVFGVWIVFFDQNNLFDRFSDMNKLKQLEKEKEYYQTKIKDDQQRILELTSDKDDLEKFAREKYLMKKNNEDVFLVVEED
ncbi:MAG: septum formation initiator family protein [Salinivirgaceae bacterium]|jgi:cell division protein FtsB|nr:septum formation initiator family protein [Salinivirgaceae bacterium]